MLRGATLSQPDAARNQLIAIPGSGTRKSRHNAMTTRIDAAAAALMTQP
jgi:hypothetical protein